MTQRVGWLGKLVSIYKKPEVDDQEKAEPVDEFGVFTKRLASIYVEPDLQISDPAEDETRLENVEPVPAFDDFATWLSDKNLRHDGSRQWFLLAEAGMGKSALMSMWHHQEGQKFRSSKFNFIAMKLCPDSVQQIEAIRDRDHTVLLLDGLDGDRAGFEKVKERVIALLEATKGFYRVVISCRTAYFPTRDDDSFWYEDKVKVEGFSCPVRYISAFSNIQVDAFLDQRYRRRKAERPSAARLIKILDQMSLLPMLLGSFNELMELINLSSINRVFEGLFNEWLNKQTGTTEKEQVHHACRLLARYMIKEWQHCVAEEQLAEVLEDQAMAEILNNLEEGDATLLHRGDGQLRFAQQSFAEYLTVGTMVSMGWHGRVSNMMARFMRVQCLNEANLSGSDMTHTDLRDVNLNQANLNGVNLQKADLRMAQLSHAYLFQSSLVGANLSKARLTGADLVTTNLGGANLSGADLSEANLSGANLRRACLAGTCLAETNLSGAHLRQANISGADLSEADLSGADLCGANLADVQNWKEVSAWDEANIYDVEQAPEGFQQWVLDRGAIEEPLARGL